MALKLRAAAASAVLIAISGGGAAFAQKPGGVLRMPIGNSPASMSIHEETTRIAVTPMMAVFNNLVLFDQHIAQNTFESIRPDLAESWSWDEDKTSLTFRLRSGVKWHDSTAFTAKDVQCTWDLITGKSSEKLRVNPRKSWYRNLAEVTADGEQRSHLSSAAAAAFIAGAAGVWGVAGLPMPRVPRSDAPASDRHWSIQICRV
jgi:peptide/nickel transport system substrate-binding protein